ncbi:nuclear transport factor 2 family protein [Phenylobacterium sp.]|uniref:nuclear transport factor 2 family protein n=1 Tax=Phenylobacterium sp. TaxID=1871053 RepID=UPI0025FD063E|nr:nuclear transport factor 2 family protein [Phenylobacterium sp.]
MRLGVVSLALAAALAAGGGQAAPACAPKGSGPAVQAAVQAWFDAGRRDDLAALAKIQAPGFYAYDGGKKYEGLALGELVKGAHASGVKIEWNLHDFDAHLGCDKAWIAWINTGASGKAGALQPVTWLESAVFGWRGGAWRMEFLHSARASPPAA